MTTKATMYLLTCDVEFFHLGAINIEQPLFACPQYVVAYRVGGSALLDPPPHGGGTGTAPLSRREGGGLRYHAREE